VDLLQGSLPGDDPALEMALASAMLRRVSRGVSGPVLRVYRPSVGALAFGRRDLRRPGLADAVRAARDAGLAPVVRAPGGRAVGYSRQALVVDHVSPDPHGPSGLSARFKEYGELWADMLRSLGVDARVGEVAGEYCPGAFSVNARGRVKLVGTAQRMVRGAWLFSAVLIFADADLLRPGLAAVHRALDLPFDERVVGCVVDEAPSVTLDLVEAVVLSAYDARFGLTPATAADDLLTEATALATDHRVP
jgi:octanoyl-[GcvH]:protein N-octanoyltransferase